MAYKNYDRMDGDWSIGCSDEYAGESGFRFLWSADGGFDARPVHDVRPAHEIRRHLVNDGPRLPRASRMKPHAESEAAKPARVLTLAERAVRDYERAMRTVRKIKAA